MTDLYILNATAQIYDTTSTMAELVARSGKLVPPGSQAHIVYTSDAAYAAAVAHAGLAGSVPTANVPNFSTYTGLAHGNNPHVVNGKQAPVV